MEILSNKQIGYMLLHVVLEEGLICTSTFLSENKAGLIACFDCRIKFCALLLDLSYANCVLACLY